MQVFFLNGKKKDMALKSALSAKPKLYIIFSISIYKIFLH